MKGVIFDMDGVLLDTHPAHLRAWRRLLEEAGKAVTDSELQFVLDGRTRREILHRFCGELDDSSAACLGKRKDELFLLYSDSIKPLPGLSSFMQDLRAAGVVLAVATSAGRCRTEALLSRFGLRENFAAVITGDDVPQGKPDPAIYTMAASHLGISPEHLVVVEDAVSGVKAARSAGMRCIGIGNKSRSGALRSAGAQLVFMDFEEIHLNKLIHDLAPTVSTLSLRSTYGC